jgi:hypothetical protein
MVSRIELSRARPQWQAGVRGEDDGLVRIRPPLQLAPDWRRFLTTVIREEDLKGCRANEHTGRPPGEEAFLQALVEKRERDSFPELDLVISSVQVGDRGNRRIESRPLSYASGHGEGPTDHAPSPRRKSFSTANVTNAKSIAL